MRLVNINKYNIENFQNHPRTRMWKEKVHVKICGPPKTSPFVPQPSSTNS